MKRTIFLTTITIISLFPIPNVSATDISSSRCVFTTCQGNFTEIQIQPSGCASTRKTCYQSTIANVKLTECETCPAGTIATMIPVSESLNPCINKLYYNDCCKPCGNCTSDADWSTLKTKDSKDTVYQKHTTRTCNCSGNCEVKTEYRCASGHYGTPTCNEATHEYYGCAECPYAPMWDESGLSKRSARTTKPGATAVTDCYVAGGTGKTFYDTTGTFELTSDCNY